MAKKKAVGFASPVSVRFGRNDAGMFKELRAKANASRRSLSDEIKYLVFFGMACADNPDLPGLFVSGTLEGIEESRQGLSVPYEWGVLKQQ
jgi:hypothetical protein